MLGRSYRGDDLLQADTSVRIKASSRFRSRSRTQRLKRQSCWSLHHFAPLMRHRSKDAFERLLESRPVSYTVVVFMAVVFVCDGCSWSIASDRKSWLNASLWLQVQIRVVRQTLFTKGVQQLPDRCGAVPCSDESGKCVGKPKMRQTKETPTTRQLRLPERTHPCIPSYMLELDGCSASFPDGGGCRRLQASEDHLSGPQL